MPQRSPKSTYFFIGRLSDHTARYQVQQKPLINNFYFEVFLDGISIWGSSDKEFKKLLDEVREIFNIIISAFVFKTKKPLSYTLQNWVEVKEFVDTKNVIGWLFPPFSPLKPHPERSRVNTSWKKAAWFYNNLSKGNNNHALALKDYRSAVTDTSDDAFLFSYRSIEDICRAVTGCDEIEAPEWREMHRTLSTSKHMIDPLKEVADKVRHGNKDHIIVAQARSNRDGLVDIAHEVIKKEFERTFPKFF